MSVNPLVLTGDQIGAAIPTMLQLGRAHFTSQCFYTVVKLGVPNILGDSKLSTEEIAKQLPGTPNRDALQRCMRLLSLSGIFEESAGPGGDALFGLTPAGALLQTGAPQPSMACGVLHWMEKPTWGSWAELSDYVAGKTDKVPYETCNGDPVFDFFAKHPESATPFNEFMSFFSEGELPVVLEHGGWEALSGKTVVDVGGSLGAVMGAVATKFPEVKCVTFDLPEVIDKVGAPPSGVLLAKGDMFDASTLPKGDAIFMKHILHDWSDRDSVRILKSCHAALPDHGTVIIADAVLPDAGAASGPAAPGFYLDMLMCCIGGKERTKSQWSQLASDSGFKVKEVKMTGHPTCHITVLEKQ